MNDRGPLKINIKRLKILSKITLNLGILQEIKGIANLVREKCVVVGCVGDRSGSPLCSRDIACVSENILQLV